MPDLGKYAVSVFSAYGASLGLLLVLVIGSLWRGRQARAQLEEIEAQRDQGQGT